MRTFGGVESVAVRPILQGLSAVSGRKSDVASVPTGGTVSQIRSIGETAEDMVHASVRIADESAVP